jgi:hypothetical protein
LELVSKPNKGNPCTLNVISLVDLTTNPFKDTSENDRTMQSPQPSWDLQCHRPGTSCDPESHAQKTIPRIPDAAELHQQHQTTKNSVTTIAAIQIPSTAGREDSETYIKDGTPGQFCSQLPDLKPSLSQLECASWHKPSNFSPNGLPSRIIVTAAPSSPKRTPSLTADFPHPQPCQMSPLQDALPLDQLFLNDIAHIQMSLDGPTNMLELSKPPPKRPMTSPPPLFPHSQARQLHQTSDGAVLFNPVSNANSSSPLVPRNRLSKPFRPQSVNSHALNELSPSSFGNRASILSGEMRSPCTNVRQKSIALDLDDCFDDKIAVSLNVKKDTKISNSIDIPAHAEEPAWPLLQQQQQQQDMQNQHAMQQQPCLQEISPQTSRYPIGHEVHTHSTKKPSLSSLSTCDSTTTNSTIFSFQLSRPTSQTSPLSVDSTTNFITVADVSLSGFDKQQPVPSDQYSPGKYSKLTLLS